MEKHPILTGDREFDRIRLHITALINGLSGGDIAEATGLSKQNVSGVINRRWDSDKILDYLASLPCQIGVRQLKNLTKKKR